MKINKVRESLNLELQKLGDLVENYSLYSDPFPHAVVMLHDDGMNVEQLFITSDSVKLRSSPIVHGSPSGNWYLIDEW